MSEEMERPAPATPPSEPSPEPRPVPDTPDVTPAPEPDHIDTPPPGPLPPAPLPSQQIPSPSPPARSGCGPSLLLIVLGLMACGIIAAALAIGAAVAGLRSFDRGLSLPIDSGIREVETRTFDAGSNPRLVVRNANGRTEIRSGDTPSIQVEATKRASGPNAEQRLRAIQLDLSQTGDTVRLGYQYSGPSQMFGQGGTAVDFVVTTPRNTIVDVEAGNGEVSVDGVAAATNVRATNGAVTVRSVDGPVVVGADNGRVTLDRTRGRLEATTNNGAIEADVSQADTLRLRSRNGAVSFAGALGDGPHEIQTSNGGVKVTVPADQKVRLDVQTDNGAINSQLALSDARVDRHTLSGTLNGGGPTLTVRTNNGSITLATR